MHLRKIREVFRKTNIHAFHDSSKQFRPQRLKPPNKIDTDQSVLTSGGFQSDGFSGLAVLGTVNFPVGAF
jgi:hypothetical protein